MQTIDIQLCYWLYSLAYSQPAQPLFPWDCAYGLTDLPVELMSEDRGGDLPSAIFEQVTLFSRATESEGGST